MPEFKPGSGILGVPFNALLNQSDAVGCQQIETLEVTAESGTESTAVRPRDLVTYRLRLCTSPLRTLAVPNLFAEQAIPLAGCQGITKFL